MATVMTEYPMMSLPSENSPVGVWPHHDRLSPGHIPPMPSPTGSNYCQTGSNDNLVEMMGSPHHPSTVWMNQQPSSLNDYPTAPYDLSYPQEDQRSPDSDSGIYSTPGASPQSTSDYEYDAIIPNSSLPPIGSFSGQPNLIPPPSSLPTSLPNYTTSAGHTHTTPQLFTSSALQYPATSTYDMMFQTPPYFSRNHEVCDGVLPIVPHDRMNPIQFYEMGQADPLQQQMHSFVSTAPYDYPQRQPKVTKRQRKPKVPAQVDPSEIKDIPASAQLWEFLLKVLKKPKYAYMVSWENKKEGLFRFHDPPAFAALWGRHRNRPCMTYDKVARALRYYYRRDILEQVGGRLTYKFSSRLCKQFADTLPSTLTTKEE